jgi:hypothetical protein
MFQRRKPLAICQHNGDQWCAFVYRRSRGQWSAQSSRVFPSPNAKQLPDAMLAWSRAEGARRVRIVIHGEVHSLRLTLPSDAHPEEVHTAIAYEAASETGVDAHLMRVSAARANHYRMGAGANLFLVVGHDLSVLNQYHGDCVRHRLRFEGVACLELVALSQHARESAGERFLFLRRHEGFLAVPATENTEMFLRGLAFGAAAMENADRESEWMEQSRKSFELLAHTPIHMVTSQTLPPSRIQQLRKVLGEATELHIEALDEFAPRMLTHVAWSLPGGTEQGCALVGMPPKPKDPRRVGSWAAAAVIVLAALCLAWLWKTTADHLDSVRKRHANWETLTAARKAAAETYQSRLRQRNEMMQIRSVIQDARPLCRAWPPLLEALRSSMPPYTRVTTISQAGPEIVVKGRAMWPRGAALLGEAMEHAMRPHGYQVQPGGLTVDDTEGERFFSYHLVPGRGP